MTVRWVFGRDDQRTHVELAASSAAYVVRVIDSAGAARLTILPTVAHAILYQAQVERRLTIDGWHLMDFSRAA